MLADGFKVTLQTAGKFSSPSSGDKLLARTMLIDGKPFFVGFSSPSSGDKLLANGKSEELDKIVSFVLVSF